LGRDISPSLFNFSGKTRRAGFNYDGRRLITDSFPRCSVFRSIVVTVLFSGVLSGVGFGQAMDFTYKPNQEDWTRMAVDRSVLPPLMGGVVGARADSGSYSSELVRMQWRPADPIDLWIIKPHGVEKPKVVLYLYSFPSDVDLFRQDSWCQGAIQNGMAAVGFVSALTGERFRGRPMREWFIPELQESMASSAHDVQLIIDYLARRGDLDIEDGVGMFGQGSGGAIAILAASADPRIRAVDVLNPWGDWPDWLKTSPIVPDDIRSNVVTPDFLQKVTYVEPTAFLPALKNRALRVQQIMDYAPVPVEARDKIAAAVPAGDLVQYKDRAAHIDAWKKAGLNGWLASQLGSKAPAPAGTASR
jgi:hypothetical protein